jgi:alkyl hydroperoxide reductase subunit AhpC
VRPVKEQWIERATCLDYHCNQDMSPRREPVVDPYFPAVRLNIRLKFFNLRLRNIPVDLKINDIAPDFEAHTTEGPIRFHNWIGESWCVLVSHPKDFTPVCTTELGYMARIKPEFDKRNVKIIGLSVAPVEDHAKWANDIKEAQGYAPNYPMIGDTDLSIAKTWGMLPAAASGDASKRTAAHNQTVRNVFVIGPDKKIKLILVYPMTSGRNFDEVLRVIDSLQLGYQNQVNRGIDWPAIVRTLLVQLIVMLALSEAVIFYLNWSSDVALQEFIDASKSSVPVQAVKGQIGCRRKE